MQIRSFGISDRGITRAGNEDYFLVDEKDGLFLVADGMGGLSNGAFASKTAIETVEFFIKHSRTEDITWPIVPTEQHSIEENRFLAGIFLANQRIFEHTQTDPTIRSMGTTLTGILLDGEQLVIANVGDTRAYLINNGDIKQLTQDHTMVMEEVRKGNMTLAEARIHPKKHIITRAVGTSTSTLVDIFTAKLLRERLYLICSDGLTDMVSDEEIASVVQSNSDSALSEIGKLLIKTANEKGGKDNITVVLLYFFE